MKNIFAKLNFTDRLCIAAGIFVVFIIGVYAALGDLNIVREGRYIVVDDQGNKIDQHDEEHVAKETAGNWSLANDGREARIIPPSFVVTLTTGGSTEDPGTEAPPPDDGAGEAGDLLWEVTVTNLPPENWPVESELVEISGDDFKRLIKTDAVLSGYKVTSGFKLLDSTAQNVTIKGNDFSAGGVSIEWRGEGYGNLGWVWQDNIFQNATDALLKHAHGLYLYRVSHHIFINCGWDKNGWSGDDRWHENHNAYFVLCGTLDFVGGYSKRAATMGFKLRGYERVRFAYMLFEKNIIDIGWTDDEANGPYVIKNCTFDRTGGKKYNPNRNEVMAWSLFCVMKAAAKKNGQHFPCGAGLIEGNKWIGPDDLVYTSGVYVANFYGPLVEPVMFRNNDLTGWTIIDQGKIRNGIDDRLTLENNAGL